MIIQLLKMSCVILVFLELFLQASAAPGRFHHDHRPLKHGFHGSRPGDSWIDWGHQWDRQTTWSIATIPQSYHGYDEGSADDYSPQVPIYNPTPRPTKKHTTGVIYSTNTAKGGNSAIVTSEATLVMGENSADVTSDRSPVISDASAVSSGEANTETNQRHDQKKDVDLVTQIIKNDENEDYFQNNGQNSGAPDGTVTLEPEEEQVFNAAGVGSIPVPALNDTGAPSFQWHVGVYSKAWTPYMQICGGSLVKRDVVISAAHCFWADAAGQQPATQFAVAGGKLYRPWISSQDEYAQRSDVAEIILPVRFRGVTTSFQDDIAVLRLITALDYTEGLRPVCVDFGVEFERQQLVPGNLGTVAGWGLTEENGGPSQRLNFLELPYVDVEDCVTSSEPSFLKYITSDKICAGDQKSGKALCRGDSGGGLIFFANETPYLRGIASTAAGNENLCNAFAIATFTQIQAHRTFLRDNIPDIEKECARSNNTIDAATGNGEDSVIGAGEVDTGIADDRSKDVMKGNADETTSGPLLTYIPHLSRVPFTNLYCNCNCKP